MLLQKASTHLGETMCEASTPTVNVTWGDDQTGKPVGIWIRVSTEDQAEGESPEIHEKRARYYAEAKGWRVVEVYDLSGVSGKTVINHELGRKMLEDASSGKIEALIFSKLARLGRNTQELLEIADRFRDYGTDFGLSKRVNRHLNSLRSTLLHDFSGLCPSRARRDIGQSKSLN